MRLPKPLEKDIQKQCLLWLKLTGCLPIRVNSGAFGGEYKGKKRFVRMNSEPGCSDILAVLPDGRFLAAECKRPGGKATPEQLSFLDAVRKRGGLGVVVSSVDELVNALAAEGYLGPVHSVQTSEQRS